MIEYNECNACLGDYAIAAGDMQCLWCDNCGDYDINGERYLQCI